MLDHYSIDGHPVFDQSNPIHRARLEEIMAASHLREGGVLIYNTTGSDRAQRTGCLII
jgi:hypothetical protein